jgi:hypothetical protein
MHCRATLRKEQEIVNKAAASQDISGLLSTLRNKSAPSAASTFSQTDSAEFSYDSHVPQYDIGR